MSNKRLFNILKLLSKGAIQEINTSDIWIYVKLSCGIAICWTRWNGSVTHYATDVIAGYTYYRTFTLPFAFKAVPFKIFVASVGSGYGVPTSGGLGDTTSSVNAHFSSNLSGTQSCTVNLLVIGLWKPLESFSAGGGYCLTRLFSLLRGGVQHEIVHLA